MKVTDLEKTLQAQSHQLPETAQDIIGIIGCSAASQLIMALGGRSLSFPSDDIACSAYDSLRDVVDEEHLQLLIEYYRGDKIYIPQCKTLMIAHRNRSFVTEVQTLLDEGHTKANAISQLCGKYGFSDRYGWAVLSGKPVVRRPKVSDKQQTINF